MRLARIHARHRSPAADGCGWHWHPWQLVTQPPDHHPLMPHPQISETADSSHPSSSHGQPHGPDDPHSRVIDRGRASPIFQNDVCQSARSHTVTKKRWPHFVTFTFLREPGRHSELRTLLPTGHNLASFSKARRSEDR